MAQVSTTGSCTTGSCVSMLSIHCSGRARKQSEEDIGLVVCKVLLAVGRASMVTPGYKVKRALDSL